MADVYVQCRTALLPAGDPVGDVYVSIHQVGVYNSLASGTTDANGTVFLGAQDEGTYEIHLTPNTAAKVQQGNLQTITVVDEDLDDDDVTDPNIFDVLVDISALSEATDAAFCRCSGYFIDPYGVAVDQLTLRFSEDSTALPNLIYYSGQSATHALVPAHKIVRTDKSGFASLDLLRGKKYLVYMEGYENLSRTVLIPDATAAPLPDVIFAAVDGIEYSQNDVLLDANTPSLVLTVGDEVTLTLETVFRSGLRLDGVVDINLSIPEQDTINTSQSGSSLVITALAEGDVLFEVTRVTPESGSGIEIFPDPGVRGALSVTVNP
jgi:hypothetical protein